jgi:glycosyltransferase involved in cell wall biosynthesis
LSVSILILTLNEEINVADCIASVRWSDDIVVLDSYSTDKTEEIATSHAARVIKRKFDNWSSHQNWALEHIKFKYPWVFYIDADERCPHELAEEIRLAVQMDKINSAFRVKRMDFLRGTWLKHAQLYPTWLVRLFQPDKIRFERLVNPKPIVDGTVAVLKHNLLHYPFSHGVGHWISRHNGYSDMEALETIKLKKEYRFHVNDLLNKDPNLRRIALKNLFYHLPARPLIKFLYYYVIRRGFLDGSAGLQYCLLQTFYEYMIVVKTDEIYRKEQSLKV